MTVTVHARCSSARRWGALFGSARSGSPVVMTVGSTAGLTGRPYGYAMRHADARWAAPFPSSVVQSLSVPPPTTRSRLIIATDAMISPMKTSETTMRRIPPGRSSRGKRGIATIDTHAANAVAAR